MANENISYYEANIRIPNRFKKKNDYIYNPNDFPLIRGRNGTRDPPPNNKKNLSEGERKRTRIERNTTPKRKKVESKGYDKDTHNSQIWFPNSRDTGGSQNGVMLNLTPPNGKGGNQGELERGTNNGKSIKGISEILNRPIYIYDKKNHKEKENKNNNKVTREEAQTDNSNVENNISES